MRRLVNHRSRSLKSSGRWSPGCCTTAPSQAGVRVLLSRVSSLRSTVGATKPPKPTTCHPARSSQTGRSSPSPTAPPAHSTTLPAAPESHPAPSTGMATISSHSSPNTQPDLQTELTPLRTRPVTQDGFQDPETPECLASSGLGEAPTAAPPHQATDNRPTVERQLGCYSAHRWHSQSDRQRRQRC